MSNDANVDLVLKAVERFNQRYKTDSINTDTTAALISIEQNKQFFKTKLYIIKRTMKHKYALKLISDNFPYADLGVVANKLIKSGYFPLSFYRNLLLLISLAIQVAITYFICGLNLDEPPVGYGISIVVCFCILFATALFYTFMGD